MKDRVFRAIVGTMVLVSILLAQFHSDYWLLLTAFIGLNLLQSSITKWCLLDDILKKVFKMDN